MTAKDVIAKDLTCSFLGMDDMADTAAVSVINALANAGLAIVPIRPSERMIEASKKYMDSYSSNLAWWDSMLQAAREE